MVATSFWEGFFLFLIFLPLAMMWGFAMVDIFRRDDMGGWSKALWVTCVILVPFFGTLMLEDANREFVERYAPTNGASQLATLADLHDLGKLTDDEFTQEKARLLGAPALTA